MASSFKFLQGLSVSISFFVRKLKSNSGRVKHMNAPNTYMNPMYTLEEYISKQRHIFKFLPVFRSITMATMETPLKPFWWAMWMNVVKS